MPYYISSIQPQGSPDAVLKSLASYRGIATSSAAFAQYMDDADPLGSFRQRFCYPKKSTLPHTDKTIIESSDEECIYMCGNSLGLKPRTADEILFTQMKKWADMGVDMHFQDPIPAVLCDQLGRESLGRLVGATPPSVALMNSLTVNLHLLLISFYQPTKHRFKILIEKHAFPSDRYAVRSQAKMRGFDPSDAILEVSAREGELTIRTEDILEIIESEGESIAVICLSGVQYYTGQLFEMKRITQAGKAKGCFVGWDLAHAVGNVELKLDEWDVDFACWCNYKYLNSGAGTIGGAYVNEKHKKRKSAHLHGWWSNKFETRFQMQENCDLASGVDAFKLSNTSPFLVSCVLASLKIFDDAGMDRILDKQRLLTGYLEYLLTTYFCSQSAELPSAQIITPTDTNQRGSQLSISLAFPLKKVHEELQKRGVVCDIRLPNVLRLAPAPLYNSYTDVYRFVQILIEVIKKFKSEAA